MPQVHPTAIVSPEAKLAGDVVVGPYCIIEGPVTLGAGVTLASHVCLRGPLTVGTNTQFWSFCVVGFPPQDYKFGPDDATAGVVIGDDCIIREYASIHAATNDHTPTTLGNGVFVMGSAHIGHDARIDDETILVNNCGVAGHAHIGPKVTLSGGVMIHQFCRIGRMAFFSAGTGTSGDVPPFCVVNERQRMGGVNLVGMRRAGMDRDEITAVRRVFRKALRTSLPKAEILEIMDEEGKAFPAVAEMAAFVRAAKRPICPGRGRPSRLGVSLASEPDE